VNEFNLNEMDKLFETFIEHTGYKDDWSGTLEFSAYIGFWPFNCINSAVRNGGCMVIPHKYRHRVAHLQSPHARTLLLAYKQSRNSPMGRVKTFFKKWCHGVGLILAVIVGLCIEVVT
jgi:hypothetical protein